MKNKDDIFQIKTISQLHELMGLEKPLHPLVTLIDLSQVSAPKEMLGTKISSDFYMISLKDHDCGMQYGRGHYDFEEGVLIFFEPGQVVTQTEEYNSGDQSGWMLFFHPDLIRTSPLGDRIDQFSFWSYEANEALHLSDKEREMLYDCAQKIRYEYSQNIDSHTQELIVSNLELMLNYSNRFYERQFHTRKSAHSDVVIQFEKLLKNYVRSEELALKGIPSVKFFAEQVHLSPNYLSDLLKKETGRNAKEHVNRELVSRAKTLLLNSNSTVSEIAYQLGYNYPHYFTRMFKLHTGQTPNDYRTIN